MSYGHNRQGALCSSVFQRSFKVLIEQQRNAKAYAQRCSYWQEAEVRTMRKVMAERVRRESEKWKVYKANVRSTIGNDC